MSPPRAPEWLGLFRTTSNLFPLPPLGRQRKSAVQACVHAKLGTAGYAAVLLVYIVEISQHGSGSFRPSPSVGTSSLGENFSSFGRFPPPLPCTSLLVHIRTNVSIDVAYRSSRIFGVVMHSSNYLSSSPWAINCASSEARTAVDLCFCAIWHGLQLERSGNISHHYLRRHNQFVRCVYRPLSCVATHSTWS